MWRWSGSENWNKSTSSEKWIVSNSGPVMSSDHKGEDNDVVVCRAKEACTVHTIALKAKSGTLGAGQRHTSGVQAQRGARGSPGLPGTKCRPLRAPPPGPSLFCPFESPYEEYTLLRGFPVQCLLRKRTLETYWIYIIWSAPSHWANNNRGNNRRVSSFLEWGEGVWNKVIQWCGSTIWCWGENRKHGDRRLLSFSRGGDETWGKWMPKASFSFCTTPLIPCPQI